MAEVGSRDAGTIVRIVPSTDAPLTPPSRPIATSSQHWAELGAVTTAGTVAATILCCLPFAAGVVGAAAAAFGARLAVWSPYLSALSITCLAYAFYDVYWSGPARCADGSCRTPPALRRRRLVVWITASGVALLLTTSRWASWVIYWAL